MSKKILFIYLLYVAIVFSYFLYAYPLVSFDNSRYPAIAHAIFFSKLPLPILLLLTCIQREWVEQWKERLQFKSFWLENIVISLFLLVIYEVAQLPFHLLWYIVTHVAETSHQTFASWSWDQVLDFVFTWILLAALMSIFRPVVKRWPNKWYLVIWLLLIPFTIIFVYVQPVLIDPLYQDFSLLKPGELRNDIEALTEELGLTDPTILQVNRSEEVSTFNAYVTGIFGNARIVLWDTTLNQMKPDEVLFILTHEIGHYTMHHVYVGTIGYLLFAFLLLFLTSRFYRWLMQKKFPNYRLCDIRAIPIILVIVLALLTVSEPVSLFISREMEKQADNYAIRHTEDLEPALASFERIAKQAKSDTDPLFFVKWMRYSHPPMQERINKIEKTIKQRETHM
ncbi:protease HtpX [Paraliobacillus ryukyuensis]|uniref:Zn-dependent protease with chaperone function n=1 Tax=Paraliobacillus ryukyuensis TaxID=200904 RepID=A0A366E792_9BACI|nr:M48 family metalloprotease [Paraliobacillus ryukyuensis]RBO98241.1 Zn-dependent protease with chaperone function [Paraliobacillus ryukyuensis]